MLHARLPFAIAVLMVDNPSPMTPVRVEEAFHEIVVVPVGLQEEVAE
ncbi:MAG TPA: hypothetical protein PKC74_03615 [Turneriella sp.]|nr:hypothetical protein [Turneriella sp.]